MDKLQTTDHIARLTRLSEDSINEIRFEIGFEFAQSKLPALPTSVWNVQKFWNWWLRVVLIVEKSYIGNVQARICDATPSAYRSYLSEFSDSYIPTFWSSDMIRQGQVTAFNNQQKYLVCQE